MHIIKSNDIKKIITECFGSDNNYIKYHWASDKGLESCIEITFNELKDLENYSFFEVYNEDKLIGMFGVDENVVLNPFFIKPEFRKKEYVKDFWNLVKNELNKTFLVGLYTKNEPVIKFFLKNGGKIVAENNYNNQSIAILQLDCGGK